MIQSVILSGLVALTSAIYVWAYVIMDPRGAEVDHTYPLAWRLSTLLREVVRMTLDHLKLLPKVPNRKVLPPEDYYLGKWNQDSSIIETMVVSAVEYDDLKMKARNAEARLENLKGAVTRSSNRWALENAELKDEAKDWRVKYEDFHSSSQTYLAMKQKEISDLRQTLARLTEAVNGSMHDPYSAASLKIYPKDRVLAGQICTPEGKIADLYYDEGSNQIEELKSIIRDRGQTVIVSAPVAHSQETVRDISDVINDCFVNSPEDQAKKFYAQRRYLIDSR